MKKTILKLVAKNAYNTAKEAANSACIFVGYQEAEPEALSKLKKKND